MKTLSLIALSWLALVVPGAAQGTFDLEKTKAVLTAEIERELDRGCASISIALVREGDIVWTAAFGYANVWAKTPAQPKTIYCTGSTFKAVTATAILQLVEEGEVLLDDPINDYLGEHRVADIAEHPVTFRHILTHSSGLTAGARTVPLWSRSLPRTLPELISTLKAERPPEEKFEYNNNAYGLAGYLVEQVSGESYESYVAKHILNPLGIVNQNPVAPTPQMVERMALPYIRSADGPRPVARVRFDVFPAGDVHLCAEDMARFLAAHLNNGVFRGKRILSEASVEEAHRNQFSNYGLGWGVNPGNPNIITHGGGVAGFTTIMSGDLEAKVGVYVMSNSGELGRIGSAALALLRGEDWSPPTQQEGVELAPELLDTYVGRYELSPEFSLTVTRDGKRMYVQGTGQGQNEMFASAEDEFFLRSVEASITFEKNDEGTVDRLVLHQGGDHVARRVE